MSPPLPLALPLARPFVPTLALALACGRGALAAEAAAAPPAPPARAVSEPYGPTHPYRFDLDEGTWISADQHGATIVFALLGDLWRIPSQGGEAVRLTEGPAWDADPMLSPDGTRLLFSSDRGGNENIWWMPVEGGEPRALTDEPEARLTEPLWDADGEGIIARRRTVDTRSIGVTELWRYHLDGGKGYPLTRLDAHPHAGEAVLDGRYLYFSSRHGRFEYGGDPVGGLWSIHRLDRTTGRIDVVVTGPGSAARPTLSPDGRFLAFISRDRTETLLERVELASGRRSVIARDLDRDQLEGFALRGTYPRMDWTAEGILLWAQGKLWRVDPESGARRAVPFRARGELPLHDVARRPLRIEDEVVPRLLRWPAFNARGDLAFSALGQLWLKPRDGEPRLLSPGTGYAPAWSPDGKRLAWTSWSDERGGALHITEGKRTETLPVQGQLLNPAWSEDGRSLLVLRGVGGSSHPDLGAEPAFELVHLQPVKGGGWRSAVVASLPNRGANERAQRPTLHQGRVWYLEDRSTDPRAPTETLLASVALDGTDRRVHLNLGAATDLALSPDLRRVAYRLDHQVWVTALPALGEGEVKAGEAVPARRVSEEAGDGLAWTPDGRLVWVEAGQIRRLAVPSLDAEVAAGEAERIDPGLRLPRARPEGRLALVNARVLTMADRDRPGEALEGATILIDGERIRSVRVGGPAPEGARVVDLAGKTVIPGLIDVHAHMHYGAGDVLPEQEWRYQVSLDFGVTTVHDPSASTDLVFTQAERVAAGLMEGPRVYSTGFVLYGARANAGAPTPDREAAYRHVRRLAALGAPSVKVYQQSRRDQRQWYAEACAELGVLCVAEGGGDTWMDLGMVLDGYQAVEHSLPNAPLYADVRGLLAASASPAGAPAASAGTAYTPTLLVAYGGLPGEGWFFQHEDPLAVPRLLRHHPRRLLDQRAWRHGEFAREGDWHHERVAREAAALARAGVLVTLGAHGQLQGLGVHWELWALAGPGAMSPAEALRAATIDGARYLGLEAELGSVEEGKRADLVVLDADPREDIRNSLKIHAVIHNGAWRP